MIRTLFFVLSAALIFSQYPASGQTAEQIKMLQSNPALTKKLGSQINIQKELEVPTDGVPTSQRPKELNANDQVIDRSLVIQSIAPPASNESVVQQYYRVLSGEILPVYGLAEFSQKQDESQIGRAHV